MEWNGVPWVQKSIAHGPSFAPRNVVKPICKNKALVLLERRMCRAGKCVRRDKTSMSARRSLLFMKTDCSEVDS